MNKKRREERNSGMLEWYDALVFALVFLVLIFTFCGRIVAVDGSSMVPTLHDGDRLIVRSMGYTPERGDVVVVDGYISYNKPLVKRVIAVGGDVVNINFATGQITLNGEPLTEPYIAEPTYTAGDVRFPLTVPPGKLFVLGDNRQHSTDSRSTRVGFIDERDILGKVQWRIFPLQQIGRIE